MWVFLRAAVGLFLSTKNATYTHGGAYLRGRPKGPGELDGGTVGIGHESAPEPNATAFCSRSFIRDTHKRRVRFSKLISL